MNDLTPFQFYSIATGISGFLYILMALIKKRSKFWWFLYGLVICLIATFIALGLENIIKSSFLIGSRYIFLIGYGFIYLLFILFLPKSELTAKEKAKIEKINDFIFNIFIYMKQKDYDEAYSLIKNGLKISRENPILKQLEYSFEHSDYDYKSARKRLTTRYKILLFFKNIGRLFGIKPKVDINDDIIDV